MATQQQIDLEMAIAQDQISIMQLLEPSDSVAWLNNFSQLSAGMSTVVSSPSFLTLPIAGNGGAFIVTASKIQLDIAKTRKYDPADVLSMVGNVVSMMAFGVTAFGLYIATCKAAAKCATCGRRRASRRRC